MSENGNFSGFPEAGLDFLANLKANNNKDWFEANRAVYETELLEPAKQFITEIGSRLQTVANVHFDTRTNGSGSLMRIYRDTRFSKDKSPYKSAIAGMFWEGAGKKNQSPAFGFHLAPEGMGLMAGLFGFDKPKLQAYREAVDNDKSGTALVEAVEQVKSAGDYTIGGEHYKRVPNEYDKDHPRAHLLRHNGLWATSPEISRADVTSTALADIVFDHFYNMAPVEQWLVEVFG